MATRSQISDFLNRPEWPNGVKWLVRMQFRHAIPAGNFEEKLWEVICAADTDNLGKLYLGFPEEVTAYRDWAHGDLGDKIRDAGLSI